MWAQRGEGKWGEVHPYTYHEGRMRDWTKLGARSAEEHYYLGTRSAHFFYLRKCVAMGFRIVALISIAAGNRSLSERHAESQKSRG